MVEENKDAPADAPAADSKALAKAKKGAKAEP